MKTEHHEVMSKWCRYFCVFHKQILLATVCCFISNKGVIKMNCGTVLRIKLWNKNKTLEDSLKTPLTQRK